MEVISNTMSFADLVALNFNCNASKPGNVNPEFGANEPGCGCTFSYNGGAGGGTAAPCCDGSKPYESDAPGFSDKKRDCECESSRLYQAPLVNKKPDGECSADFKYVPEFNYPPPPCPPIDTLKNPHMDRVYKDGCESTGCYQGGLSNKKTPECSADFKYVVPSAEPEPPCKKGDSCCGAVHCKEPDTYESIRNTDAQRYKGKGPDRSNFYADENCGCSASNNASSYNYNDEPETDWAEIRRQSYSADSSPCCSPKRPSFCIERENYTSR